MSWTEERIALLAKLWEGGATASQIAEQLGGVSRNAVIGKAHRLGLKARPSPVKPNDKKPGKKKGTAPEAEPTAPLGAGPQGSPPLARPQPQPEEEPAPPAQPPIKVEPAPQPAPIATTGEAPAERREDQQLPRIVSYGPGGFLRQGPGDQQAPIPPAPPRRLVPAKPSPEITGKTSLLDLSDKVCRWPMGHPGEPDFHFCGEKVNPGFPYCVAHCGRAYQAQLPRGVRRPPPPLPFGGPRVR